MIPVSGSGDPDRQAMLALVLMDDALRHRARSRGRCGLRDSASRKDRENRKIAPFAEIKIVEFMQVDHDLHHDIPELTDAIHALKAGNAHFAKLFASYHRLTGKVEDLEEHDMPVADFTIEDMKQRR